METLITIVVPIYKVEQYINKCIDSIINQTYTNLEILLVDDGSPDNCGKICDDYAEKDSRIHIIHKKNGGLSDARNAGIEIAKGEYITFIDSDDYVEDDYIEYLFGLIKEFNSFIAVCTHYIKHPNGKIDSNSSTKRFSITSIKFLERMLYHDIIDISAWAKLYKTDLFCDIKYPVGKIFEDAGTTYKLIDKCDKIACGFESKYYYMLRKNSIVTSEFNLKKLDLIDMTNEMTEYLNKKYPELKTATLRRQAYAYLSTLRQMVSSSKLYREEERKILNFIKLHRKELLLNHKVPVRDKFAIVTLLFGVNSFAFCWRIYCKLTDR